MKNGIILFYTLFAMAVSAHAKTSVTGAEFTPAQIPALGESYVDPSGLLWGDVVKDSQTNETRLFQQIYADRYCKDLGFRLPTNAEFKRLAEYLGQGSSQGYSPLVADGSEEVLPGLSVNSFWEQHNAISWGTYIFAGNTGEVLSIDPYVLSHVAAVRCVSSLR